MKLNLKEIEKRLAQIAIDAEVETADLDALQAEAAELQEQRKQIMDKAEQRKATLQAAAFEGSKVEQMPQVENNTKETPIRDTQEYRDAWLKQLQGAPLSDIEQRSINAAGAAGAIPTITADKIIDKLHQIAPILGAVELLRIAGNVTFGVEGSNDAADLHTENGEITPATDTVVPVTLGGYEVVKALRISATVKTMAISDFENWLVRNLSERIAQLIEKYLVLGTGTNQPQGVDYARTWTDDVSAIQFSAAAPTYKELCDLVGLLGAGYFRNAHWLMNHNTFWTKVQSIRDDGKYPIAQKDGDTWRVMGVPVLLSDYVPNGDFFLGDFKKIVANLSQDITVESSPHSAFTYNAVDYRGVAIFDSKVALGEAFVKGANNLAAGA